MALPRILGRNVSESHDLAVELAYLVKELVGFDRGLSVRYLTAEPGITQILRDSAVRSSSLDFGEDTSYFTRGMPLGTQQSHQITKRHCRLDSHNPSNIIVSNAISFFSFSQIESLSLPLQSSPLRFPFKLRRVCCCCFSR